MPDASCVEGLGESPLKMLPSGKMIQLVRFGFCIVEKTSVDMIELVFSHP
ncbi:MAG: hypothetical protein RMI79_04290 [Nitrososphaerota archaeon]|nr:hypothetical protein [Nitrososphaerota archaeon]